MWEIQMIYYNQLLKKKVLCYDKENYINDYKEKLNLIFENVSSPESGLPYEKYKVLLKHDVGEYIVINGTFKQKILGALQLLIGKKIKLNQTVYILILFHKIQNS